MRPVIYPIIRPIAPLGWIETMGANLGMGDGSGERLSFCQWVPGGRIDRDLRSSSKAFLGDRATLG
jgi:hypothetical protein